ncbi:MAG: cation diffusion facilitator family transporter [Anaerolineales bacterium]|nr:cation diffusion facilitator family transporter [Anaerolineales bacterium]
MESVDKTNNYAAVRRVLLAVLVANLAITAIKIVLGLVTGALAVVADGFHSLVDSSSNLIGLAAIRLASRPADEKHPYGYQRYETLGALAIGGLLLAAAWEIVQAVIERFGSGSQPDLSWLTIGLVALTFPVNLMVVILETRAGKRLKSEILLADATHTRTDLYVTASVLASLVGVWLGWPWLDQIVALGVVVMILRAAFHILRKAAGWLADNVGVDPAEIDAIAHSVPGVRYVHRVRSRGTADTIFADLHVKVDPWMSTSQAHAVASEVERRLKKEVPIIKEALVHIEPAQLDRPGEYERIAIGLRQIADSMGLGTHDLHVHAEQDHLVIELHLEMPADLTLLQADQLADEFEQRACAFWPQASRVVVHMEPLRNDLLVTEQVRDTAFEELLAARVVAHEGVIQVIEVLALQVDGHKNVIVRPSMAPEVALSIAHARAEEIERDLLLHFNDIHRVTVHVEPAVERSEMNQSTS